MKVMGYVEEWDIFFHFKKPVIIFLYLWTNLMTTFLTFALDVFFSHWRFYLFYFKDFIYLFLERGERREKERERNISVWLPLMCGCLSCARSWEPGPQPRHVPWLGTEPVTFWLTDWHSIYWATLSRASLKILNIVKEVRLLLLYMLGGNYKFKCL